MAAIGLALGGGGARGIAHINVLAAFDDLGLKPARISGSSIGAIIGAGYASGMNAAEIGDYLTSCFANRREIIARLWATRPPTFQDFLADGGLRLGQLNIERMITVFMPGAVPPDFERLQIPLTVMATDFYAHTEVAIETGDLVSALAASAALPAVFRPVRRDGRVLIDGGIYNPLPFDRVAEPGTIVVACDVNGGPEETGVPMPSHMEAVMGASQLMMQSMIDMKLRTAPPDILLRPYVAPYKVLDFMRAREILAATSDIREGTKRAIERAVARRERGEGEVCCDVVDGAVLARKALTALV